MVCLFQESFNQEKETTKYAKRASIYLVWNITEIAERFFLTSKVEYINIERARTIGTIPTN
jgi:Tfp pilus assembly protein PilZ